MMKRILAVFAGLFAFALPGAALAQCGGIFPSGYFCSNPSAGGTLAGAASPTATFDRAFGAANNSTVVRIGGVWTVLSSANSGVWITSAAGVPSIGSTLPNAVQDNITRLGTIVSGTWTGTAIGATVGGTGQTSYAIGDILFANTISTLSRLADVATGNALISGGVNTAPSWGKIGISTHVSGLGTGIATALGVNVGTAGSPVVNGGALGTPASGTLTSATGLPLTTGVIGQLPIANGGCNGTTAATCLNNIMPTPTRAGDVAYWNGTTWTTLAGNNSGTNVFTENASGVPSWVAAGTGTVTSAVVAGTANNISVSGTCTITTTGTCTVDLAAARKTTPTTTELTSGTDVAYVTPANALWLEGFIWGSGGGGGGGGAGAGSGSNGNPTCWKVSGTACTTPLYQATGGLAAGASGGSGGAGGGTAGSSTCNATGTGSAGAGVGAGGATLPGSIGGPAANRGIPGFGAAPNNNAAPSAPANSGAGGGGGSTSASLIGNGGGGGGWCYFIIGAPGAGYVYTIGTGGAAGAGGTSGGAGGTGGSGYGYIIAHYNFLLKRDLEAGNDNTPAFLNVAA